MIGKKKEQVSLFQYFCMRDLVPEDHILKLIDKYIDLSFIRDRVRHLYSEVGRPSVDPELMIRMMLVGYLFGIKSERRLCEEVKMHVGYRWFVGLEMHEKVPDHSTFSKNRHGRFAGSGIWEEIFNEIVRRCIETGLVSGKHITADGTLVAADASISRMEEIKEPVVVDMKPQEYIETLDKESSQPDPAPTRQKENTPPEDPPEDPDGMRLDEFPNKGKKISNETHRSTTDPDSRIARKGRYSDTKLAYQVGYLMDNSSRVILDAAAATQCGRRSEMILAIEGLERIRWKFRLYPETIGADRGYAGNAFLHEIYDMGITPHVPVSDPKKRVRKNGIYTIDEFTYDESLNQFTCPQDKILKYHNTTKRQIIWRASTKDCSTCPVKSECTRDRARSLSISVWHEAGEKARDEMETEGYMLSQLCRKKIEELFGEGKENMGMRRMKRRGLDCAAEQVFMTAAAQNMRRLVKHLRRNAPKSRAAIAMSVKPFQKRVMERIFVKFRHITTTLIKHSYPLPSLTSSLIPSLTR